jgi:hypothetical protein
MEIRRLPATVQTLYSELLDQSILYAASENATGIRAGSFVSKTVKGRTYWYLQRSEGHRKRQVYLGPDSEALEKWMAGIRAARRDSEQNRNNRERLCSMLTTGGAASESPGVMKVLQLLVESRVFSLGGVLVGTQAFRCYGNMLGVRFEHEALRTEDVDIAHDPAIGIVLSSEVERTDVPKALAESDLDLRTVPGLDPRKPSTSFSMWGQELRVDFLTPMRGRESSAPVFLPAFNLSAQPMRFLEFLTDVTIPVVVIGGHEALVNVPEPARFAFHKLWSSERRSAAFQAKARKDVFQAEHLLGVLVEDRPGDIAAAWQALEDRPGVRKRVRAAIERVDAGVRKPVLSLISTA